jgi:hypothetical protein
LIHRGEPCADVDMVAYIEDFSSCVYLR